MQTDTSNLVLTFDELLKRTCFARRMSELLVTLEKIYQKPVDVEFTVKIGPGNGGDPDIMITLLQCRPQSHLMETEKIKIPVNLDPERLIFSTHFVVPQGFIDRVDYVLFVPHEQYFSLTSGALRNKLARTIGKLNAAMEHEDFICVGPGRWGSSNPDLGVSVAYGDIYNTQALLELAGEGVIPTLEPSLGTHFFQDLMEAQIYPLGILLDREENVFNNKFFYEMPNHIADWINVDPELEGSLRLIRVRDYLQDHHLRIIMDSECSHAVGYLVKE
jgi:hypothetical protein